jgi:hypothetical protein
MTSPADALIGSLKRRNTLRYYNLRIAPVRLGKRHAARLSLGGILRTFLVLSRNRKMPVIVAD